MRYRLLIFDFDGTLADSFPLFLGHLRQTIAHFNLRPIAPEAVEKLRASSAPEVIRYLGIPAWKVPAVARFMRGLMTADAARTPLFPGVLDLLHRLANRGVALAVVSSNSEANIRQILGPDGQRWVGAYECGASLFGKAAKFRKVLRETKVPAVQVLTIGDEIRDFEAAQKARVDFGAVAWGYTHVDALRARIPAFTFERLEEIEEAVFGPDVGERDTCSGTAASPAASL
jgi:phosphoglycolate phosphatase